MLLIGVIVGSGVAAAVAAFAVPASRTMEVDTVDPASAELVAIVFGGRTQCLGDPVIDTENERPPVGRRGHLGERVGA